MNATCVPPLLRSGTAPAEPGAPVSVIWASEMPVRPSWVWPGSVVGSLALPPPAVPGAPAQTGRAAGAVIAAGRVLTGLQGRVTAAAVPGPWWWEQPAAAVLAGVIGHQDGSSAREPGSVMAAGGLSLAPRIPPGPVLQPAAVTAHEIGLCHGAGLVHVGALHLDGIVDPGLLRRGRAGGLGYRGGFRGVLLSVSCAPGLVLAGRVRSQTRQLPGRLRVFRTPVDLRLARTPLARGILEVTRTIP